MFGFIYKILNKLNNKVYIGQSKLSSLDERLNAKWVGHFTRAFEMNSNLPIHIALRKYGKDNFIYEVIEDDIVYELLDDREKFWISKYNSTSKKYGYNATKGGKEGFAKVLSGTRRKHTEAAKQKMREAALHRPPMSDEVKQKISNTKKGHKLSAKAKENISNAHKGIIKNELWRKHLSESRKGFKMSEEQKKKISEKLKAYFESKRNSSKMV